MLESEEYKKWIHELFLNPRRVCPKYYGFGKPYIDTKFISLRNITNPTIYTPKGRVRTLVTYLLHGVLSCFFPPNGSILFVS
jgi:hypothetical protein